MGFDLFIHLLNALDDEITHGSRKKAGMNMEQHKEIFHRIAHQFGGVGFIRRQWLVSVLRAADPEMSPWWCQQLFNGLEESITREKWLGNNVSSFSLLRPTTDTDCSMCSLPGPQSSTGESANQSQYE